MSEIDERISTATEFIDTTELPPAPEGMRGAESLPSAIKPASAEQSLAVNHGVLSFLPDLPSKHRETVANSFLLAQLAADKQAAQQDLDAWYDAFFSALRKLGWLVQEQGFKEYRREGRGVETHEAILDVAATLLGSATAAFDLVRATLGSLKKLSEDEWIVLFRQDEEARAGALFQLAVAERSEGEDVSISLMAFQFSAKTVSTRVVFLTWDTTDANIRQATGKVFFANAVAEGIRALVARKVHAHVSEYVTDLEI